MVRGEVASSQVPEPFWDFDPNSEFTINYDDVDAILGALVVDVGRSSRRKTDSASTRTGTRLKAKVKRTTSKEGNRIHFEAIAATEEYRLLLGNIRRDLESIPDQIPLQYFSREEQLAYWLNLYNIALIDRLVQIYPEKNLKQELLGRNSILDDRFLVVAGVPLSLNDIQHTILRWNYDSNPLVIYGLYQGVVGGPNIRKVAYTGENVDRLLNDNAEEFINSNRGTYFKGDENFHVSTYYTRNLGFFDNLDSHLKTHLLRFIENDFEQELLNSERLIADIQDWTITDVHGTSTRISESFARNPAAVIGSAPMVDEVWLANITVNSDHLSPEAHGLTTMTTSDRFGPHAIKHLDAIREQQSDQSPAELNR